MYQETIIPHMPCDECGKRRPEYASCVCRPCFYLSDTYRRLTTRQRGAVERAVNKDTARHLKRRARRIAKKAGVAV